MMIIWQKLRELKLNRFEILVMIGVHFFGKFARSAIMGFPVFGNITPMWRCSEEESFSRNCSIYTSCLGNLTFESPFFSSRQDFGLICDHSYQAALMSTVLFFGILIGACITGQISDLFGRRRVLILAISGQIALIVLASFSTGILMLTILLFLAGLFAGADLVTSYVLLLELIKPQQRLFMNVFVGGPLAGAIVLTSGWLIRDWRWFLRVVSMYSLPSPFLLMFVIPESVKWAGDRDKHKLRERSQRRVDKINGRKKPKASKDVEANKLENPITHPEANQKPLMERLKKISETTESPIKLTAVKPTLTDLISTPEMRVRSAGMCFLWMSVAFIGYTIGFDSRNLDGDFFFNQFIFLMVNIASNLTIFITDTYVPGFSRRLLHQLPQGVAAVLTLAITVCYAVGLTGQSRLAITVLAVMASFFMNPVWDSVYLCTAELFPTEVRSSAFSLCNFFARIGVMLAPQAILLRDTWEAGPYLLITIVGFITLVVSCCFLPDTRNKELPKNVEDVCRNKKHSKDGN